MSNLNGLVAYPSEPTQVGQAITAAIANLRLQDRTIRLSPWEENDIAGRFITAPILQEIEAGHILVADVTRLNFNVVFEIGYAIGRKKRAFLIRNSAITGSDDLITQVGLFDTLGYAKYATSNQLASHLSGVSSTDPLNVQEGALNKVAPVYLVVPRTKSDAEIRIISRVKKARLQFRTFDPEEHGRLPAGAAIDDVAQSLGVITSLLPSVRVDADVHNYRAAFVAGLAMGMEKPIWLLQEGEDPCVPSRLRSVLRQTSRPLFTQVPRRRVFGTSP